MSPSNPDKKVWKHSALYRYIEGLQGDRSWGSLLDAGSGAYSLRWVQDVSPSRWTAVTASPVEADQLAKIAKERQRPQDQIVLGNWADPQLLQGEVFDTVLVDYLLGAIEGFAPYSQSFLFRRLRALTGKTLYVTGLEPYVPVERPDSVSGGLLWEIGRFRDACVLLAGGIPYREYPADWVADQLNLAGFHIRQAKHFGIGYRTPFVEAQIEIALNALNHVSDRNMVAALSRKGEALRAEARQLTEEEGALRHCRNYVIAAEPKI